MVENHHRLELKLQRATDLSAPPDATVFTSSSKQIAVTDPENILFSMYLSTD
jgi:hypothetical protein